MTVQEYLRLKQRKNNRFVFIKYITFIVTLSICNLIIPSTVAQPPTIPIIYHNNPVKIVKQPPPVDNRKVILYKYLRRYNTQDIALELAAAVIDFSEKYNIDYLVVLSIIKVESDYTRNVVNHKNCYGFAQVRTHNHDLGKDVWFRELKEMGIINKPEDLLKPYKNIEACCYILSKYLKLYGDLDKVISRYSGLEYNPSYLRKFYSEYNRIRSYITLHS